MPSSRDETGTVGQVLAADRQQRLVGRRAEMELGKAAIASDTVDPAVRHLHGPGGIGKMSLLQAFAAIADAGGATVVRLDARESAPSPSVVLDEMRQCFKCRALGADREPSTASPLLAPISAGHRRCCRVSRPDRVARRRRLRTHRRGHGSGTGLGRATRKRVGRSCIPARRWPMRTPSLLGLRRAPSDGLPRDKPLTTDEHTAVATFEKHSRRERSRGDAEAQNLRCSPGLAPPERHSGRAP
jgi:hypothetical protein